MFNMLYYDTFNIICDICWDSLDGVAVNPTRYIVRNEIRGRAYWAYHNLTFPIKHDCVGTVRSVIKTLDAESIYYRNWFPFSETVLMWNSQPFVYDVKDGVFVRSSGDHVVGIEYNGTLVRSF